MIKGGYILQPRIIDDSDVMSMPPVTREIWYYILRNVNHNEYKGIDRGCGFFQYNEIQNALCWYVGYRKEMYSKSQIAKSLRRLSESNMIETTKEIRGILVTVCKYAFYQDPKNYEGNDEETTKETRRKSGGHTINKNVKNDNNEKNEKNNNISSNEENILSEKEQYEFLFEEFWNKYDKKVDRDKCLKKWMKLKQGEIEKIFQNIEKYVESTPDKQFRKNPLTYLNSKSFENEIINKSIIGNSNNGKQSLFERHVAKFNEYQQHVKENNPFAFPRG